MLDEMKYPEVKMSFSFGEWIPLIEKIAFVNSQTNFQINLQYFDKVHVLIHLRALNWLSQLAKAIVGAFAHFKHPLRD